MKTTSEPGYLFKSDDGTAHMLSFEQAMNADAMGYFTLPCGTIVRRVRDFKTETTKAPEKRPEIVSDALGFPQQQLETMREQLKQSGCRGIEFTRDPAVPEFIQVRAGSQAEYNRYAKARGYRDMNGINGASRGITQKELDDAKNLLLRT